MYNIYICMYVCMYIIYACILYILLYRYIYICEKSKSNEWPSSFRHLHPINTWGKN